MSMRAPPPEFQRDLRATSLRLILLLGVASLFGSLISNGARSVTGPYLLLLGGSAAVVGLVAGAGEFIGYALIIAERIGKAIRTPARETILSHATVAVGRGWGFGFHKALDQVGAVAGPLVMVVALAVTGGYTDGFLVLAIPLIGVAAALFLALLEVPSPRFLEVEEMQVDNIPSILPYALFIFPGMAGFATFPLISFHLKAGAIVSDAAIPLFYAGAMVVSVFVALLLGRVFDRAGVHIFLSIPIISLATVFLAFSNDPRIAVAGSLVWGAGIGLFEPLLRASIAESTSLERRGKVYGHTERGRRDGVVSGERCEGCSLRRIDRAHPHLCCYHRGRGPDSLPLVVTDTGSRLGPMKGQGRLSPEPCGFSGGVPRRWRHRSGRGCPGM